MTCIRRCRAQSNNVPPLTYLMNSLLIIFLILLSVALVICRASNTGHDARNLSSGFPTKRVLNQYLRLNRLARNLNVSRSKCRYDSSKKADNKVADETGLRLYCYKSLKAGFCSRGPIAIHEGLENTGNMITQTYL